MDEHLIRSRFEAGFPGLPVFVEPLGDGIGVEVQDINGRRFACLLTSEDGISGGISDIVERIETWGTNDLVATLNREARTRLGVSPHGVGVFALRPIEKGERLYADKLSVRHSLPYALFSRLRPEVAQEIVSHWPAVVGGSAFLYPPTFMQAYMNHADDPNYDVHTDIALRDIAEGEEVTEDYRRIEGWREVYPWMSSGTNG